MVSNKLKNCIKKQIDCPYLWVIHDPTRSRCVFISACNPCQPALPVRHVAGAQEEFALDDVKNECKLATPRQTQAVNPGRPSRLNMHPSRVVFHQHSENIGPHVHRQDGRPMARSGAA